jgi:hypothetical protein
MAPKYIVKITGEQAALQRWLDSLPPEVRQGLGDIKMEEMPSRKKAKKKPTKKKAAKKKQKRTKKKRAGR